LFGLLIVGGRLSALAVGRLGIGGGDCQARLAIGDVAERPRLVRVRLVLETSFGLLQRLLGGIELRRSELDRALLGLLIDEARVDELLRRRRRSAGKRRQTEPTAEPSQGSHCHFPSFLSRSTASRALTASACIDASFASAIASSASASARISTI